MTTDRNADSDRDLSTSRAAVVFDLDGVLIDTEPIWDETRRSLAKADGAEWPETATTDMQGMSTPEWARYLVEQVGINGTADEAAERTIAAQAKRYREHLPVIPGAEAAVRRMATSFVLGLTSSSPVVLIRTALDVMGVTELFAATVSTEEVARGKPAPDGYLECARRIGVDPSMAVGIEDSSNGLRSLHAAGYRGIVAVPHTFNPPAEDAIEAANLVLAGIDDLTVDVVKGLLAPGA